MFRIRQCLSLQCLSNGFRQKQTKSAGRIHVSCPVCVECLSNPEWGYTLNSKNPVSAAQETNDANTTVDHPGEGEKEEGSMCCCCTGLACCCDCLCALARGYVKLMQELPPPGKAVLIVITLGLLGLVGFGAGLLVNHLTKWYYGDFE